MTEPLLGLPLGGLQSYHEVTSTNDLAMVWAEQGAPDQALIVADFQSAGKGRFQRRWITAPGSALAFSLIFHPTPTEKKILSLFSPLGGVALAETLREDYGLETRVKYPNDVLYQNCKCCGILSEAVWIGDQLQALVVGMGINVLAASVPPANELFFPATSLEEALGKPVDRFELLARLLQRIFSWRARLGSVDFFRTWEEMLAFRGEQVRIQTPDHVCHEGILRGIDPDGSLIIQETNGNQSYFLAGDVHVRQALNEETR